MAPFRILLVAVACGVGAPAAAADWIFAPSTFTHDPQTGDRLGKVAEPPPQIVYPTGDFVRSGYRQNRSTIRTPLGADNLHIVEEWGRPVRPYGEWQYPYRPFSVPYSQWGPPFYGMYQFYRGWPGWGPFWRGGFGGGAGGPGGGLPGEPGAGPGGGFPGTPGPPRGPGGR